MTAARTICIIALLGIALMCGCTHPQPQTAMDVPQNIVTPWQVNTPNPLLVFVPENAAFVIATQRKRDMHSTGVLELLNLIHDAFGHNLTGDLDRLMKDYGTQAPTMGLDPNGHFDLVTYLHDDKAVMHITVADEIKAAQYIQHLLEEKAVLTTQNEQNWMIYSYTDPDRSYNNVSVATHIQDGMLSLMLFNTHIQTAPQLPAAHKKHFAPKVTNDDTVLVAYIHYERLVDFILKKPANIEMYDYHTGLWHQSEGFDSEQVDHPTEWLKANGHTSIGDDVCIREFKSMVSELTSSNWELTLSDNGIAGMRFDTVMTPAFLGDIKSLMTEHVVLNDSDAKARGYVSFSMDKAVKLIQKIFLTQRDWKCTQARIFVDHIIDDYDIDEIENFDYQNNIKDFESLSFMIKSIIIPNQLERQPQQFLMHIKYGTKAFNDNVQSFFDIPSTDGIAHPIGLNSYHKYAIMFQGNDTFFGSDLPAPDEQLQRKMDAFVDLTVHKDFLYPLLKDEVPNNLLGSYHIHLGIENNALVFSILPKD